MDRVIKIEPHNCSECYRCIRACRVKAIEINENQATVRQDECTRCGECIEACPHEMISLRHDAELVRRLIKKRPKVIASLHWSWPSEFAGVTQNQMVEALQLLGFSSVSESLHGSEYYDRCVAEKLEAEQRPILSVECPVVVRIIMKKYPNLVEKLPELASPAVLHSRLLRKWYGDDIKVVHITPCTAMKPADVSEENDIDAVITFNELREWMWEDGVEFDFVLGKEECRFVPHESGYKRNSTLKQKHSRVSIKGYDGIIKSLRRIDEIAEPAFVQLWSCVGGCLEGTGASDNSSIIKKVMIQKADSVNKDKEDIRPFEEIITREKYIITEDTNKTIAQSQIEKALRDIGKERPSDYLNCNACGYETCREFARAMVESRADSSMCMSYNRNLAQKKFTALLNKMPSGVMLVDQNLKIIEANQNIADILGTDAQLIFGANEGMKGADLEKLITFAPLLSGCLAWNKDKSDEEVMIGGKVYRVSVFTIEPHRVICVVINHVMRNEAITEEMRLRTKEIIKENLVSVQKIAHLLGETASRTEAVLNSIIEQE